MRGFGLGDPAFLAAISSRLWTPADITTALWLDATDASTITTVSGTVSEWRDKSGNNRHATQSAPASRPAYDATGLNGKGILTFDGINDFMPTADFHLSDWFILCVARTNSATTSQQMVGKFIGNDDRELFFQFFNNNTLRGLINPVGNVGASNSVFATTITAGTSFGVFGFYKSGTACELGINGIIESGSFNTSTVFNGNALFTIGADSERGTTLLNGAMQQVVVLPSAPSSDVMRRLEGWAAWDSGLQGSLPNDHPFKNAPPRV